jgi:hypothetical protein
MIQASFFWRNNLPGGIGITFGPPNFTPAELSMMFEGEVVKRFMRDSDAALGNGIVHKMLEQLTTISHAHRLGDVIPAKYLLMVALNIIWLSSRGFIPNDEFNGPQYVSILPPVPRKEDHA